MDGYGFSEAEVEQINLIAREEFEGEEDWILLGVNRRSGTREVVDLRIQNTLDRRTLTIPLTCTDFPGGSFPNGSLLTDAVFDISISLMEFRGIRGFDEFEDGSTVPILECYPRDRRPPDLGPGVRRHLVHPPFDPKIQFPESDTEK